MKTAIFKNNRIFLELAQDHTKSIFERHMSGILARGYSNDYAIVKHAADCGIDESESAHYLECVLSDVDE